MVDYVKNNKDGLHLEQLAKLMGAMDSQPDWRSPASIACAYYDGDQLSDRILEVLHERGQPKIVHNMIGPTIDGVLGMEARTRSDLMVSADDDEGEEIAVALNEEFKDAWQPIVKNLAKPTEYLLMDGGDFRLNIPPTFPCSINS